MEQIWDTIYQDESGIIKYDQEKLDLILKCINDKELLKEVSEQLRVGIDPLSSYITYFNKIKEYFDIQTDIIEVGFGRFPIMSFLIDQEQSKYQSGSITAYDILSIQYNKLDIEMKWKTPVAPLGNIKYRFAHLSRNTISKKYDLIFGIKTCSGAIDIVRKANNDKKDFFIQHARE